MKKLWLMFRTEHNCVHYLWNGEYVVLVYLPQGVNPEAYYWMGGPVGIPPQSEIEGLNKVASSSNKSRIFKFASRPGIRYIVVAKGEFVEE
jgi:hypothetical protein